MKTKFCTLTAIAVIVIGLLSVGAFAQETEHAIGFAKNYLYNAGMLDDTAGDPDEVMTCAEARALLERIAGASEDEPVVFEALEDDASVTRIGAMRALYELALYEGRNTTSYKYFKDYPDAAALNWATSAELFEGAPMPGDKITRGDFYVMASRYMRHVTDAEVGENYSDDCGIRIIVPGATRRVIPQSCDFYVVGNFMGGVKIPDDAHVELTLTRKSTGKVVRTVYSDRKNDTDNLYLDYDKLIVSGDPEMFIKNGMPDLVYDSGDPESFKKTYLKCFYTDDYFSVMVWGGAYDRDVDPVDQYGETLGVLGEGDYDLDVRVTDRTGDVVAYAHESVTIGVYPDKIISPFRPVTHRRIVEAESVKTGYEMFLDAFPGYWYNGFIDPEWEDSFRGQIVARWRLTDAHYYDEGDVHLYLYGVGRNSVSNSSETIRVQAVDGNLDRVTVYHYALGEPLLWDGEGDPFVQMDADAFVAYTRVEHLAESLGDNQLDMKTLGKVPYERCEDAVSCDAGETIALYGVCRPIEQPEPPEFDENYIYSPDDRIVKLAYTLTVRETGEAATFEKEVGIVRIDPPEPLDSELGIYEFKHDFEIPEEWSGMTVEMRYDVIDATGAVLAEGVVGPTIGVRAAA